MQALSERTRHPDFRPWYREPWPWVLIAIPALTIIACGVTLWLALANPDYLVVDDDQYQAVKADLQAQQQTSSEPDREAPDGDR
jgi:hypothetical protein